MKRLNRGSQHSVASSTSRNGDYVPLRGSTRIESELTPVNLAAVDKEVAHLQTFDQLNDEIQKSIEQLKKMSEHSAYQSRGKSRDSSNHSRDLPRKRSKSSNKKSSNKGKTK